MKNFSLLLLFMAFATCAHAQKVELAGQLNTGLARFGGEPAAKSTAMSINIEDGSFSTTYNPYGKIYALSYGASVQVQRVTRSNFLIGNQVGAESLRSRINISEVYVLRSIYSSSFENQKASGKAILRNDFINLHPYLGYRVSTGTMDLDFSFGPDVGIGVGSREKGEATAEDGTQHATERTRSAPETDVRTRLGITAYRNHFGITTSYAHGLTNYLRRYDGGDSDLYARAWRVGVLYRL